MVMLSYDGKLHQHETAAKGVVISSGPETFLVNFKKYAAIHEYEGDYSKVEVLKDKCTTGE
jgi:hypothetical protein